MVHYRGGRAAIDPAVYADMDAFWADLTAAYADQVRMLAELGCRYLQFDDTSLAYLNDPRQREYVASIGGDPERQHIEYIRHINEALAGRPPGMAVTTHMCRGNFRSSWAAEGDYSFVAEPLFGELDVDGFFLEYDDERSGGFEPLRFLPPGKRVVLGLVTTKRGALEGKDDLKRRIEQASRYVPIEQICLSPQCGFSSTVEGNVLTREEQVGKAPAGRGDGRGGVGSVLNGARETSPETSRAAVRGSSPHRRALTPTPGTELDDVTPEDLADFVGGPPTAFGLQHRRLGCAVFAVGSIYLPRPSQSSTQNG